MESQINMHLFCFCLVDGGHRAIIFDRFQGVKQEVMDEGTHFMVPWLHKPYIFDVRTRPRSVAVSTGSKGTLDFKYTVDKLKFTICCFTKRPANNQYFTENFVQT